MSDYTGRLSLDYCRRVLALRLVRDINEQANRWKQGGFEECELIVEYVLDEPAIELKRGWCVSLGDPGLSE